MTTLFLKTLGLYLETLAIVAPSAAARKGFKLFCRPFRASMNEKQLSFLNASEQFRLMHEEHTVQGYRWGHGPRKVLFLHGWQSHTYRWKPYIEALPKDQYTIYSLDAPGHGLSSGNFLSVPLYSGLIESFIQKQGDIHGVVAHSLGGFSLLYSLYRAPQLPVGRVVLLAPPGEANEFVQVFQKTLGLSEKTVRLVIDHFAQRFQVTPEYFSARKFAEAINVKGLIIHDEDDKEAPYPHTVPLHQAWRGSQLITTKGFGHNLKSPSVVQHVVDYINAHAEEASLTRIKEKV